MDRIPVAIVGAGYATNGMHLPAWRKIKEAVIVAVCDADESRARTTARRWNIPYVYTSFDKLLEEVNGVIDLSTPPATHASLAVRAMEEGHDVILEKPMAMSLKETQEICDEYQKRRGQVRLWVVQNFLFESPILGMKSILDQSGADILSVDISMLHTPTDAMISNRDHWVHSLPGGRFGECMIHPVYVLRNLLGSLRVRDVYTTKRGPHDWVDYDEVHVTFDSGDRFGSIYASFNSPRWTLPLSVTVNAKGLILDFDGSNLTCTVRRDLLEGWIPELKIPKTKMVRDSLSISWQTLMSTASNALSVLRGQWKTGHENLFRSIVEELTKGRKLVYSVEEASEANRVFLDVLARLGESGARA